MHSCLAWLCGWMAGVLEDLRRGLQMVKVLEDFLEEGGCIEGLLPSQLLPSMEAPERRRAKRKQEQRGQAARGGDYLIL